MLPRQPRPSPPLREAVHPRADERVRDTNPALLQALLAYVVKVMAERLSFANRAIEVLQR
jgi:hypothetical protein